jgi:hypothetical protein
MRAAMLYDGMLIVREEDIMTKQHSTMQNSN